MIASSSRRRCARTLQVENMTDDMGIVPQERSKNPAACSRLGGGDRIDDMLADA
jgi:hypothetical protein